MGSHHAMKFARREANYSVHFLISINRCTRIIVMPQNNVMKFHRVMGAHHCVM
jgi:hypothetical protein